MRRPTKSASHEAPVEEEASPRGHRPAWVLLIVGLGVFIAADDQTSIVTVLPALIRDVGITVDDFYRSSWVVNGYLLGYLVALPLLGRVADVFGRRRIFVATLSLFVTGSALVAIAPGFEWLVVARAVQAFGAGGVVPVAMAIVVDELPPARRALGLGAIAAASEAGALLGPLWGGVITDLAGWRWVFWINLPMTAPVLLAGWWQLRAGGRALAPSTDRGTDGPWTSIDWRGATLLTVALTVLTFALVDDPVDPRPLAITIALLVVSAGLVAAFLRYELSAPAPMLRLAMFAARPVWAANLANLLLGGGLIVALVGVPLFVNLVLVGSPLDGGWTLMRLTAAVPVGALAGGWFAGRLGVGPTAAAGMLFAAAGFAGLQAWDRDLSEALRTVPLVIGGFGFGLVIAPLGSAVLQQVEEAERATAAAWLTMSRVIGMLVGASLLTSQGLGRFYARAGNVEFGSPEFQSLIEDAQVSTFREVFIACVLVMLAAAVAAWLTGRARPESEASWWTVP